MHYEGAREERWERKQQEQDNDTTRYVHINLYLNTKSDTTYTFVPSRSGAEIATIKSLFLFLLEATPQTLSLEEVLSFPFEMRHTRQLRREENPFLSRKNVRKKFFFFGCSPACL